MGTVLSTFPSYIYSRGEWDDLQDVFQQGLYKGAEENTAENKAVMNKKYEDEQRTYGGKLASVFQKAYNSNFSKYDDSDDPNMMPIMEENVRHDTYKYPSNNDHIDTRHHDHAEISQKFDQEVASKRESRASSKSAFQPSQSRLPTPNRSRRSSNPTFQEAVATPTNAAPPPNSSKGSRSGQLESEPSSKIPLKKDPSAFRRKSENANFNSENQIKERTFQPEPWPPVEMIYEHLSKLKHSPSTILLARFAPRNSKTYVEIQYSINKDTNETVFRTSDKLDTLLQNKDGSPVGESKEEQIDYFFLIFKTCINLLQGQVWWNGYSLIFDQNNTKNRLKVSAFETEPSQLLFELTNMKDLEVHRSSHNIELKCKNEGSPGEYKSFRIRGPSVRDIKVNKLRGTLITVHVPEFNPEIIPRN